MDSTRAQLELMERLDLERAWALGLGATGVLAVLVALALWLAVAKPLAVGAAWPLAVLGAIHALGGGLGFVQATQARQRLPDEVREAPHLIGSVHLERARDALVTHQVLEGVDAVLLVLGAGLAVRAPRRRGVGLGLLVMSALALVFDASAARRQQEQVALLERFAASLE